MKKLFPSVIVCVCAFLIIISHAYSDWVKIDGLYGANVTCLAKRGNLMFAGTDNSKIFKSTDAGKNWEVAYKVQPGCIMNDIQIFGNNVVAASHVELFQSQDLGKTWDWARGEIDKSRYIRTLNSVRCGRKLITVNFNYTIYFTDTTENKWYRNDSVSKSYIYNLVSIDTVLYASASKQGIIKSTDYGYNWQTVKSGNDSNYYISLSISNNCFYAGKWNGSMSVSTDGGANWYESNTGLTTLKLKKVYSDAQRVFICKDTGINVSYNKGLTWKSLSPQLDTMIVYSVITDGENIYVGTAKYGVMVSSDEGLTWSSLNNGLDDMTVRALGYYGNNLYIANDFPGCYKSNDEGNSLTEITPANMISPVNSITNSRNNTIYISSFDAIYSSNDKGKNWNYRSSFFLDQNFWVVYSFNDRIFTGTRKSIFYTTDTSQWWFTSYNNYINYDFRSFGELNGRLFAGTAGDGVFVSSDSGVSWESKSSNLGTSTFYALHGKNGRVYAGTWGILYYSSDYGENWLVSNDFPSTKVMSIISNYKYLFAGTENGVFISYDDGISWKQINTGLGDTTVYSLAVDSNFLFAGTSSGLWKRSLSEITGVEDFESKSKIPELYCYPNPCKNTLNISFSDANFGNTKITIYNSLGEIVETIENLGSKQMFSWEVRDLPTGIYYCRIFSWNETASSRFVIIK